MAIAPGAACAEPGFVPSAQATVAVEPEPGSASATIPAVAASPQPDATERTAVPASAFAVQRQCPATTSQPCEPAAAVPARPGKTYVTRGSYVVPPADDTVPSPAPGGTTYHAVKRAFDLCFSAAVTVVLLVPSAVICAAIVADSPGASPIFTQKRVGQNGKPLYMYKFRSMYPDAHSNPERYLSPEQMQQWLREQKVDNDPRVTHVGRFLRKTSLDELPQFLNVLKGELSVIGPRPVTEEETYEYGTARDLVLSIKPGITGWWQVCARNEATWESGDRQALEVFYARHASLPLDLRIFARTFKAMAKGR